MKEVTIAVCIVCASIALAYASGLAFGSAMAKGAINALITERGAK